jgi:methionyl-tRNA formyltransferase
MSEESRPKFIFFGTPNFAVIVLNELERCGLMPSVVITSPDKPKGRHLVLTPPPAKVWAEKRNIPVMQPKSLKDFQIEGEYNIFILAAYGKIIPKRILDLPRKGILNVHPSLLPNLRGPSPIQSAILNGAKETGVSIMLLDEEMDHGPILASEKVSLEDDPYYSELETKLGEIGGKKLCKIIQGWVDGGIKAEEQNHTEATYCKKIKKQDGYIDSKIITGENTNTSEHETAGRRVRALNPDPSTYTILSIRDKNIRVKITEASLVNGKFTPKKVTPEGKKEMSWGSFLKGNPLA